MTADLSHLASSINAFYDKAMFGPRLQRYYQGSDYTNFGYWNDTTHDALTACNALMARLLSFIPDKRGSVLDVACGKGETSRYLAGYYREADITGINISERQLERARELVPGGRFLEMDAASLDFADASFDAVTCVEAAFHFNTRQSFLREAYRVLKPGGYLVLSDILVEEGTETQHARRVPENYVRDLDAYRSLFEATGFTLEQLEDATEPCWRHHFRHMTRYVHEGYLLGEFTLDELQRILKPYYERAAYIQYYVLASARKPG